MREIAFLELERVQGSVKKRTFFLFLNPEPATLNLSSTPLA
jgi:hypothetical protein